MNENLIALVIFGITYLSILYLHILIPRTSRKNIVFGVKLPKEMVEEVEIKKLLKSYRKMSILIGVTLFILLMFFNYRYIDYPISFLISLFLYMAILFSIHFYFHQEIKKLKKEKNWVELAENVRIVDLKYTKEREREKKSIWRWGLLPIIILVSNFLLSLYMYKRLGDTIPMHWDINGVVDSYGDKSLFRLMSVNISNLFMVIIFYLSYYFVNSSKANLDKDDIDLSIERDRIYRKSWSSFLKFTLIGLQIILTYINLAILGLVDNMKWMLGFTLIYSLLVVVLSIYLGVKLGQGGERIKLDREERKSRGYSMEDDSMWKLGGSVYYNEEDPSLFVDKRVGVGWTINLARPMGKVGLLLVVLLLVFAIVISIKEG